MPLLQPGEQQELPQEEQGDRWQHLSHKEPYLQEPVFVRPFHSFICFESVFGLNFRFIVTLHFLSLASLFYERLPQAFSCCEHDYPSEQMYTYEGIISLP